MGMGMGMGMGMNTGAGMEQGANMGYVQPSLLQMGQPQQTILDSRQRDMIDRWRQSVMQ